MRMEVDRAANPVPYPIITSYYGEEYAFSRHHHIWTDCIGQSLFVRRTCSGEEREREREIGGREGGRGAHENQGVPSLSRTPPTGTREEGRRRPYLNDFRIISYLLPPPSLSTYVVNILTSPTMSAFCVTPSPLPAWKLGNCGCHLSSAPRRKESGMHPIPTHCTAPPPIASPTMFTVLLSHTLTHILHGLHECTFSTTAQVATRPGPYLFTITMGGRFFRRRVIDLSG